MKAYRVSLRTPWKDLPTGWKWMLVVAGVATSLSPLVALAWILDEIPSARDVLALPTGCLCIPSGWFLFAAWGKGRPYVLGLLGALIAACAGYLTYQTGCWQAVLWEGTEVPVLASASAERAGKAAVIKDPSSWDQYWHDLSEPPPVLHVDWRSQMVVVCSVVWDGDFTLPSSRIELRRTDRGIRALKILSRVWVDPDHSWLMVYGRTEAMVVDRTGLPVHFAPHVYVRRFADFELKDLLTRILIDP